MSGEELLAKADEVILEKGWCVGKLTNKSGEHCALGSIGYAKFGEEFDVAARQPNGEGLSPGNGAGAYAMLASDPEGQEAIIKLAEEIKSKSLLSRDVSPLVPVLYPGVPDHMMEPMSVVIAYNDTDDSEGRGVVRLFGSYRGRISKAIKDFPTKVRHKKADPAFPTKNVVEQKAHAKQEAE